MSTQSATSGRHLSDAEIVRHIDREGNSAERARWDAHLGVCTTCAEAVERLREQDALVSAWLERADEPAAAAKGAPPVSTAGATPGSARDRRGVRGAPDHAGGRRAPRGMGRIRSAPVWLRLAASLVLVAGPLAAITPVRDWVGDRVAALRPADEPAATLAVDGVADNAPGAIRFVPDAGRFTLVLEALQAGGTLRLERAPGAEALLESGAARVAAFVSSNLLRIGNSPESATSYTLALPSTIVELEVVIGERSHWLDRADLDATRTIPLDRFDGDSESPAAGSTDPDR